jgi:hypothetical protein
MVKPMPSSGASCKGASERIRRRAVIQEPSSLGTGSGLSYIYHVSIMRFGQDNVESLCRLL